jgi:hypothetical protein
MIPYCSFVMWLVGSDSHVAEPWWEHSQVLCMSLGITHTATQLTDVVTCTVTSRCQTGKKWNRGTQSMRAS